MSIKGFKTWIIAGVVAILCAANTLRAEEHYNIEHYSVENGLSQKNVMSILQDRQGFMWFGTWDGLNRFDGYNFLVFKAMDKQEEAKINNRVDLIFEDEEERLWWMTYDKHYFVLDKNREKIEEKKEADLPQEMVEQIGKHLEEIAVDNNGIAWQVDENVGISRYKDGTWKRFTPKLDMRYAGMLDRNLIVLEDHYGRTWVNPMGGGWSCYDSVKDELINPLEGKISNMIHTAYVDRSGRMWVATYDGGVDCIDMQPQAYRLHDLRKKADEIGEVRAFLKRKNGEVEKIEKDNGRIYCAIETEDGIWYGTKGQGIRNKANQKIATSNDNIYDIEADKEGNLYVATYGGGINILPYDKAKKTYGKAKVIADGLNVRDLLLQDKILWAGTTKGLVRVDIEQGTYNLYPCYDVRALHLAQEKVWIGSFGGGLAVVDTRKEQVEIEKVETMTDIVMSMTGNEEHIWFCSEKNITQYHIASGESKYFHVLEGYSHAWFGEAQAVMEGKNVLFGYSNGYCAFCPEEVKSREEVPNLQIVNVYSKGERLNIHQDIAIEYHSDLQVEYSPLEYIGADKIAYEYKLEGIQEEWQRIGRQRQILFNNLPKGKYTLYLRSTNREGEEVENTITMAFTVLPAVWQTWWAIALYILLIVGGGLAVWYFLRTRNILRQEIRVEQEVTDIKLRFFTNVSHELRTPLTLIIGPVTSLLSHEKLSNGVRGQLEVVLNNSQRMLRMVNQLLDFRKIQNEKMRLKVQKSNMALLAEETCANFEKEALDKHILFTIEKNATDSTIWVDRARFDTILYNLLSNAFKFTPSGKKITVSIEEQPGFVNLIVKDEGIGIPMEKRSILFERFANNNELNNQNNGGTGIGMNLVKELVDLHQAFIEVESEVGKGTTFTILWRKGTEHFGSEADIIVDDTSTIKPSIKEKIQDTIAQANEPQDKRKTILVVDDNEDMRSFLRNILEDKYHVVTAEDGEMALQEIEKEQPCLIISDVMMPKMDGLEMLKKIKEDEMYCHLPVILLSAKSAIESRLEAMEIGADDYVTKPFETQYLRARIGNLLQQRKDLEANYRKRLVRLETNHEDEELRGESFLAKLLAIMEKEMSNSEFSVEDLVEEMHMSRTIFFNQLKNMTGLSPVEFIREIRIKRAAQLLDKKELNITEVAYQVGMNDARYFSKCFKSTYGQTPSEYRKHKHNSEEENTNENK